MKILHVSTAMSWRGGEQQIAYLVEGLNQKNISQIIACAKDSAMQQYCERKNIQLKSFRKKGGLDFLFALNLHHLINSEKPDIIHLHDSHAHTSAIIASLIGTKVPLVLHRRVDFPVSDNIFSRYKYNHPQIKKIICVSDAIKKIMTKSVSEKKLITIHSGIDTSRFRILNANILRKEFNISPDTKIIANIAALAPHKDYSTFLRTVAVLKHKNLNAKYLIIGEGPERKSIEQQIQQMNLQSDVILTGFRNDIEKIFPEIDLLLFTSETEGLGTTLLDAFCSNVPVVATNAGGISEMIEHEKTGLLSEIKNYESLAENVLRVFNDDVLRKNIIANAAEKAKHFSKEMMAIKILSVYEEILR